MGEGVQHGSGDMWGLLGGLEAWAQSQFVVAPAKVCMEAMDSREGK